MDTNGVDAGLTYTISAVAGTAIGEVAEALAKFESNWNTIVVNPYGDSSDVLDDLEEYNGAPDPANPTGRYQGIVFKPFVALFSKTSTDPVTEVVMTARASNCTNVYCPAPNVKLLPVEVAANVARLVASVAQNSPNLDVNDKAYPDAIILAAGIGNYNSYEYRDQAVKAGLSTVDMVAGELVIKDLVTTYNPTDEVTPQFKYVRNLILDWNIRYAYMLLEQVNVVGHTLVPDGTMVSAPKTISPAQWKGILYKMFEDLADRGLIAEPDFSKESLQVKISSTNPDRFETFFRYKRTGIARILSTTAEAGFYYGA
jgi:phage tail sheath gpL-like